MIHREILYKVEDFFICAPSCYRLTVSSHSCLQSQTPYLSACAVLHREVSRPSSLQWLDYVNRYRILGAAIPDAYSEFAFVNLDVYLRRKLLVVRWAALKTYDADIKSLWGAELAGVNWKRIVTSLSIGLIGPREHFGKLKT